MRHSREIRQLWHAATEYLKTADGMLKRLEPYQNYNPGRIAKFFDERRVPKDPDRLSLNMLLAHLSSAAVRLCTIDERFEEDHNRRITEYYLTELSLAASQDALTETLIRHRGKYMHQLLRDNVGHIERSRKHPKKKLVHARQDAIEGMTIKKIFDAMTLVREKYREELVDKKIL